MALSLVRPSTPPSRMRAAIRFASSTVAGGASSTLKATSGARPADDGVRQFAGPARERVGAAVVVGVGMHVEKRVAEGLRDPVDRGLVFAL
jgi:hypothetical protein